MTDQWPSAGVAYYSLEWAIRITAMAIVPFRRSVPAATSWLLFIFFMPVPGLLLYLAIGRARFPSWRVSRTRALSGIRSKLASELAAFAPPPPPDGLEMATFVERLGQWPAVTGNKVELIEDYDGLIDRLVKDIDDASINVRLLVFMLADDATGKKVIDALGRAVLRGVRCHVMIDAVGSRHWAKGAMRLLKERGVETRRALPFYLLRAWTRQDLRNHRKLFLIDGAIGYAGSQNIVDKDFVRGVVNQELVMRLTGPIVAEMTALFLSDWYVETEEYLDRTVDIPSPSGEAVAQLLPSGADFAAQAVETLLVWQIHSSVRHVIIVSPYFIPDDGFIGAMKTAVLRGVTVDLVVSAVVDKRIVRLAQRSYYRELLDAGVHIHQFQGKLLHAKNVCFDDRLALVGSSNVDFRSFALNEEVSVLLFDKESVAAVHDAQLRYIEQSDPILPANWVNRPWHSKLAENAARLVSPLL